jgi:hypothetical protein
MSDIAKFREKTNRVRALVSAASDLSSIVPCAHESMARLIALLEMSVEEALALAADVNAAEGPLLTTIPCPDRGVNHG